MAIHAIYGSQLGDYEWDIGKTIRWNQFLVDTGFAVDTNIGDSRNFVVAWDATYPTVKYTFVNDIPFFASKAAAAEWRKRSFIEADRAWNYDDNDWVLFIDASECLALDDTVSSGQLVTPNTDPFKKWLLNLSTATPLQNYYSFQQYAYMDQGPFISKLGKGNPLLRTDITGQSLLISDAITYVLAVGPLAEPRRAEWLRELDLINTANTVSNVYAIPRYKPTKTVTRFFKVSYLRSGAMDWRSLDDSVEAYPNSVFDPSPGINIISYAYARWAELQSNRDLVTDMPISEAVDAGFVTRKLMTRLFGTADGSGIERTTWATADSGTFYQGPSKIEPAFVPVGIAAKLRTPAYYNTFRASLRDGLYYRDNELGPVPWDQMNRRPAIDPTIWSTQ